MLVIGETLDTGQHRAASGRCSLPLDPLKDEAEPVLPAEISGCQVRNGAFVRLCLCSGAHRKRGNQHSAAPQSRFGHRILLRYEVREYGLADADLPAVPLPTVRVPLYHHASPGTIPARAMPTRC